MDTESWYVIHTKARREGFAAGNVGSLGIEIILPLMRVERFVRRGSTAATALFPGYFFARFCPKTYLEPVEYSPGVLHVVKSGRVPISLHEEIVTEIKGRMDQNGMISLSQPVLKPGDTIAVRSGPFEGMRGRLERELDDRQRVEILLENLLNAHILIEKRWLEPAPLVRI